MIEIEEELGSEYHEMSILGIKAMKAEHLGAISQDSSNRKSGEQEKSVQKNENGD